MRVNGSWRICDDGAVRPIFMCSVMDSQGDWLEVPYLADTGADQTVLSAHVLQSLRLAPAGAGHLQGVGGLVGSVAIEAQIRLLRDDDKPCMVRGQFAALTEVSALGRNVTCHRQLDVVCLLGPGHRYTIHPG